MYSYLKSDRYFANFPNQVFAKPLSKQLKVS